MDAITVMNVLVGALTRRVDVRKVEVSPVQGNADLLKVKIKMDTKTIDREASVARLMDDTRPVGEIMTEWLGDEPVVKGKRDANWHLDRAQHFAYTPAQYVQAAAHHAPRQPAKPEHPQAPGSSLDWDRGDEDQAAPAAVQDPRPAGDHTYLDPRTNEPRPMLRRTDMTKLGMSREQRHEQYKVQGGPHPDDV